MDIMRIFKRQKSTSKEAKDGSVDSVKQASESLSSGSEKSNSALNKPGTSAVSGPKELKGWRKSFRKSKKLNLEKISSSSCDNILKQDADHGRHSVLGHTKTSPCDRKLNRWSYSPDSTVGPFADGSDQLFKRRQTQYDIIQSEFVSAENSNQNIDLRISRNHARSPFHNSSTSGSTHNDSYTPMEPSCAMNPDANGNDHAADCLAPNSLEVDSKTMNTNHQLGKSSLGANYLYPRKRVVGLQTQPHATLYEHKTNAVFSNMQQMTKQTPLSEQDDKIDQPYEEMESNSASEDLSWGSAEFESDSGGSGIYDNDEEMDKLKNKTQNLNDAEKNNVVVKKPKERTKSVRRLKFLERKPVVTKANSKDEEQSSFIDFHLSTDRHPGPHLRPPSKELLPYQKRRRQIVETIISSESSYIDSLERLEISYKKYLLECKPPIIGADIVEKIFYKIADILQCHQLFQIALAAAVNDWDKHETIGDTFVASFSKSMVLECYSSFINNFTDAMETVRKTCIRKPQFLTFLRDRQNESKNRINLYGLMLKPVQRFPQFIMLVQDLLKHTPKDHDDRLPLQLALTELEILAENLNRRRAEDEEKSDMINLLDSSNIKLMSNKTKNNKDRKLLKKDVVRECSYNDDGELEKDRECLLVLTSDMLLSCSSGGNSRRQTQKMSTFRDVHKLKWCATLDIVTVTDGQSTSVLDYTKRKTDHDLLLRINDMVQDLEFTYPSLSTQQIKADLTTLEEKLKHCEDVMKKSGESFHIWFPQKTGQLKRTLILPDIIQCNEWIEAIVNAKLANDPKNLRCWYSADGSDDECSWQPPLFIESIDCLSKQNALQVQCAHAFMPANHYTLLWLACSATTVVVAVVNIYQIMEGKIEKVHVMQVESSVQCMEHWNPNNNQPSVWLGMECGTLMEFQADVSYNKVCEVTLPTFSTVMLMKGFERNLYVGLLDGSLLRYNRPEGTNDLINNQSITVGNGPLNSLSLLDGKLWGVSGNDIVTLNVQDFKMESMKTIPTEDPLTVSHITQIGSGLWVAFCDTCSLHLYHLDTLKLLQDLNLSRPVRDFFQVLGWLSRVNEICSVTSLSSSYWTLIVGMSNGLIMTMPLPKLADSVPKITGPCQISYHMLSGPVTFLCAPPMPPKMNMNSNENNSKENPSSAHEDVPPVIPERSPIKPISENSRINKHKRTRSEGMQNVSTDPSKSPSVVKARHSVIEPRTSSPSYLSTHSTHSLIPPALPPKPTSSSVNGTIPEEKLLEDDSVYVKMELEKIKTPTDDTAKFHWKGKFRDFPVLLACGDGYCYPHSESSNMVSKRATALLCWKMSI